MDRQTSSQKRRIFRAIFMLATVTSISHAAADYLDITADGFLEMNETYRAGLIHGALASMIDLGVGENYEATLEEGVHCLGQRKTTVWQTSIDFAKYVEGHPEVKQLAFPKAFLIFMLDCQTNSDPSNRN
jgi:hypothetical protein